MRLLLPSLVATLALASFCSAQTDVPATESHQISIGGKSINYETITGRMPIKNRNGDVEGHIGFTYYRVPGVPGRPLTFVWNGGPGSASIWLHMGMVGPKRVAMKSPEGFMPAPPFKLVTNQESLLPTSDFVCVDPVGTGFGRPARPELGTRFWGVQEDIDSVGEFIRSFISEQNRWLSPLFLLGESYGTFRAAGVSNWLVNNGIAVNGIVMVSTLTNYGTVRSDPSNPIPIALNLPTMAATAWYHKKLSPTLQKKTVGEVVNEARAWMNSTLIPSYAKGWSMSPKELNEVNAGFAKFSGLPLEFVTKCDGRVTLGQFYAELLRDQRLSVGRLDGRFTGYQRTGAQPNADYDASNTEITPPFTSTWSDYLKNELKYKTDLKYYVLGEGLSGPWNFGNGIADTSEALRQAMVKNPYMKVLYVNGYYDFATPFAACEYGVYQAPLDSRLRKNIEFTYYEAGHMMYLHDGSRKQLMLDVNDFMSRAMAK